MKLLVDMNLSPEWVKLLTQADFETTHWSVLGAPGASDREIMDYAKRHGFVVLTHDLDYSAILAATKGDKPSVVQIRAENVSPAAIGNATIQALRQMEAALVEGALLTIEPNRARLRLLPLQTQ